MNRREFSVAFGAAALGAVATGSSAAAAASDGSASPAPGQASAETPFSRQVVVERARAMAKKSFHAPKPIPDSFANLSYDQFRKIHFRREQALWTGEQRGFTMELLHAGFMLKTPVEIFVVEDGEAQQIHYSPDMFDFGGLNLNPSVGARLFSGIRINAPINVPHVYDEVLTFQGASYFRGVGAGEDYGVYARGLAVDTGEPKGEEFPFFRSFWVERPAFNSKTVTVHALLDSQSVTGAYTFKIKPGLSTLIDAEATLFARSDITHLGLAPLTSMYLFDAPERSRFNDCRPAAHDSDTLTIARGNGEWIMRPLANPKTLQVSAFMDDGPCGFGLEQRKTAYDDYKDLDDRYDLRPSSWVEPKGAWKNGHVELVEIPTNLDTNDNIVAYWRPNDVLKGGNSLNYAYWLSFGPEITNFRLARVVETRIGLSANRKKREFVIDFSPPLQNSSPVYLGSDVDPQLSASVGKIEKVVARHNPMTGGYQVSFEMNMSGLELSELRLVLALKGKPISETWLYRWTA